MWVICWQEYTFWNIRLTPSDHVNCSLILALWHNNYLWQFPHAYFWPRENTPSYTNISFSSAPMWYPDDKVYNYKNTWNTLYNFYATIVCRKSKLKWKLNSVKNTMPVCSPMGRNKREETRKKGKRVEEHEEARTKRFNASTCIYLI